VFEYLPISIIPVPVISSYERLFCTYEKQNFKVSPSSIFVSIASAVFKDFHILMKIFTSFTGVL
jgi:hypothetical protein